MMSKLATVAKRALLFAHSKVALSLGRQAATSIAAMPVRSSMQKTHECSKSLSNPGAFIKFISNNINYNAIKLLTTGGIVIILSFSAMYADKTKLDQVLTCLEKGTMPLINDHQKCCDRKRELSKLKKAILSTKAIEGKSGLFFVIVGPSGCGKSMLMKQLCRENPKGLIYYQVYDSKSFPVGLGRACGMSFEMKGSIWQTIVGYGNLPYKSWFVLPESPEAALSYVIEVLEKQGLKFRLKHGGKIPTIVIDAVEIIAKTDLEFFKHLIRLSKRVVNEGSLNIVLVSSEGHVVPILKSVAEKSRVKEWYVEDISEKEALDMLKQGELSEDASRQLLAISGPRLQYLKRIQASVHLCGFPAVSGDGLVKCIKSELAKEAQDCIRQARVHKASETYIIHRAIFQCVLKKEEESRASVEYEVCNQLKDKNFEEVRACMQDLLRANVLTMEDDRIKFHSQLLRTYITKFLACNDEKPVVL